MRKHIKKHHIKLGRYILGGSLAVILIAILWSSRMIDLPSSVIYYSRSLAGMLTGEPKPTLILPLKFHRQEHSLSCEAATLKMVLNYHGVEVSESEIIQKLPFDPTPKSDQPEQVGGTWGNPHLGFVGNIDGKMPIDGYGVYWEPIAVIASNWKRAGIIKDGLAEDLTENILQGRPVIVWGYLGRGKPLSWVTPDGNKIFAVNGEHTRVVYGFRGSAENPDGFFVMDPVYGHSYWEKNIFMRNWDAFGRMGVVVYP
jgi:uncharacterized protein YvpB